MLRKKIPGSVFFAIIITALVVAGFLVAKFGDFSKLPKIRLETQPSQQIDTNQHTYTPTTSSISNTSTSNAPKLKFNPNAKSYSVKFSEPYPVSWSVANDISLSLTSIKLSNFTVDENEDNILVNLVNKDGSRVQAGETAYALQLELQINTGSVLACGVSLSPRLVSGNGLTFSNNINNYINFHGCDLTFTVIGNKKAFFIVPESQSELTLTTGGNENIFFTIKKQEDGTLSFTKIDTPEIWKGKLIGLDPAMNKPASPSGFYWTDPFSNITLERGQVAEFKWKPGTYTGKVSFSISQLNPDGNYTYSQSITDQLSKGYTTSTIKVPPGNYKVFVSTPYNATARKVQLTVTGDNPKVDIDGSKIFLSGSDAVISDGICKTSIYVQAKDSYGYVVSDNSITLISNRTGDVISKNTTYSDLYSTGYTYFNFKSQSTGTSTLTAYSGGSQIPGKIFIKVLDANQNNCPENTTRYDNYFEGGY